MKAKDLTKARLWCIDKDAWSIDLQFNPTSLELTRNGSASIDDESFRSPYGGKPGWEGGERDVLEFEVLVDTSVGGEIDLADATGFEAMMLSAMNAFVVLENEESVMASVHKYYRLTLPITPADTTVDEMRLPVVAFVWESFEFMGFVDSLTTDFTLFDHMGKAKRAMLTIEMSGRAFTGGLSLEEFLDGAFVKKTGDVFARTGQTGRFDMDDMT